MQLEFDGVKAEYLGRHTVNLAWADFYFAVPQLDAGTVALVALGNGYSEIGSSFLEVWGPTPLGNFDVLPEDCHSPFIASLSPGEGNDDQEIVIVGQNFCNVRGNGYVFIGNTAITDANAFSKWTSGYIRVSVPTGLSGLLWVTVVNKYGESSNQKPYDLDENAPAGGFILSVIPSLLIPTKTINLFGDNFGSTQGTLEYQDGLGYWQTISGDNIFYWGPLTPETDQIIFQVPLDIRYRGLIRANNSSGGHGFSRVVYGGSPSGRLTISDDESTFSIEGDLLYNDGGNVLFNQTPTTITSWTNTEIQGTFTPNFVGDISVHNFYWGEVGLVYHRIAGPNDLSISGSNGQHPQLSWTANTTDIDHYEVFRRTGTTGNFTKISSPVGTSFIDYSFEIGKGAPNAFRVYYYVKSVSGLGLSSAKSNTVNKILSTGLIQAKLAMSNSLPTEFRIYNAYPNPFNNLTGFKIDLIEDSNLSISIFNINGVLVYNDTRNGMSPGQYTIFWEGNSQKGEDIPSGIYLFRVKVNDYVEPGKITLLK